MNHACKKASSKGTSREAEHVDLVAFFVVSHDKAIASDYMGIKGGGKTTVNGF